jgi:hypothetical protein
MSFWKWSRNASSNATADGSINWAEGMAPSAVNDSARAMMAAAAKFRDDISGSLATGGTSTAYTLSSNQTFDTLAHFDKAILTIVPHTDSGAAPTLNVDGLGAKAINATSGVPVVTGALKAATPYHVIYFHATTEFILVNPFTAALLTAGIITTTMLGAAQVTYATMQNVTAGKFLGGNLTGAAAAAPTENIIPFGQCRLTKSSTSLLLSPYKGNLLTINSTAVQIPDAGVTLSTSGLSSSTLYYIYAFMNSGTMTLEASATAYATQAGTGVTIKSGDATRTLIGMARTDGSTTWQDSATQRFVRSWFNDPGVALLNSFSANRSTSSASYVEINSEIRNEFLIWAGETINVSANGETTQFATSNACHTSIGFDGATAEDTFFYADAATSSAAQGFALTLAKAGLSEGYHFVTLLGKSLSGNASTWIGSGTAGTRSTLRAFLRFGH